MKRCGGFAAGLGSVRGGAGFRRRPRASARSVTGGVRSSSSSARNVGGIEQSVPTPSDGEEPRTGPSDRPFAGRGGAIVRPSHPPFEPTRRRCGIEPDACRDGRPDLRSMMTGVEKDVAKRVMHLTRRRQQSQMVAIGDDRPPPIRDSVHGTCQPRAEHPHPAPEGATIARLDDQVRVIPLQRVVHQPKPRPIARRSERTLDLPHDRHGAKRRNIAPHAEGHMRRQGPRELLTRRVP